MPRLDCCDRELTSAPYNALPLASSCLDASFSSVRGQPETAPSANPAMLPSAFRSCYHLRLNQRQSRRQRHSHPRTPGTTPYHTDTSAKNESRCGALSCRLPRLSSTNANSTCLDSRSPLLVQTTTCRVGAGRLTQRVGFPTPPSKPDMQLSLHPAFPLSVRLCFLLMARCTMSRGYPVHWHPLAV